MVAWRGGHRPSPSAVLGRGDLSWAEVAHSIDVERRKPAASFAGSRETLDRDEQYDELKQASTT